MIRTLRRTTDGYFLTRNGETFALGNVPVESLRAAMTSPLTSAPITGTLLPPVSPSQLVLVGLNYPSHAAEFGMDTPEKPIMGLAKGEEAVVASGSQIQRPERAPDFMDYEAEIAIVIGKACEKVSEEDAASCILGLAPCNDLGLRDVQFKAIIAMRKGIEGPSMLEAKVFPGSKPMGPDLLLVEPADLEALDLSLKTVVNGKVKQSGNASEMMFSPARLVAEASALTALQPGDVICSGTPSGVGLAEGRFLEAGAEVSVHLGTLEPLTVSIA